MVITLGPEQEAAVNDLAQRQNVPAQELVLKALRERFMSSLPEPRDEWERRLRQLATDCGMSLPDSALSSEGLYE
jgi:hypothetical protein